VPPFYDPYDDEGNFDDTPVIGDQIQVPPPQTDLTQFRLLLSDCEITDNKPPALCKVFCDFPKPLAP
jgi:hypothetical protein